MSTNFAVRQHVQMPGLSDAHSDDSQSAGEAGPTVQKYAAKRYQLSRHFRNVQLMASMSRFLISYWMSFSSSHGFRVISDSLQFACGFLLQIQLDQSNDGLIRRVRTAWKILHTSAELDKAQIHLYGDQRPPGMEEDLMNSSTSTDSANSSFFDSLIAFIRAAQLELLWIHQREKLEVTRNWSDLERLDIPMLQNYFKQLLHEIELHEKQFNDVHNQGAALINQRHPSGEMIEVYLRTMQNQWDWMPNLSKCLEGHLRDAYNAKAFVEESEQVEQQMQQQLDHLDREYSRTDFSLDDGEQMLRQLDSVREYIQQLHARLLSLTDRGRVHSVGQP
ncbi:hypothetical protein niasHT_019960 [Heterodera trifolii]|uniref:Uncharacterized protein n=1 Tax=Heterodera trifolii TaxID=157864 RepID=A0ABD2LGX3_9BILA